MSDAPGPSFLLLAKAPVPILEGLISQCPGPDAADLAGWEWRGTNTPWYARLLGIKKFIKGFFDAGKGLEGYNIPARQDALESPWRHRPSAESPRRFGFYRVTPVDPLSPDHRYPNSLLLDYGASPRNPSWRPERLLRDYLVQPDPADKHLLLGKAYLALGPRLAVSYFVLERLRPTSWRP